MNIEENPFQCINFDLEDEKDDSTLENRNVEDLEIDEQLVEKILYSTPAQQNLWDNDGDPLFSIESDLNLGISDLDFHNDKDDEKLENHDESLSVEVSTIFGPCEQAIQHLESESNINVSDHELLEHKLDKHINEQELDSTILWRQALIDPHAINLEGYSQPYYILKIVHKESFQHWKKRIREINDKEINDDKELAWSCFNKSLGVVFENVTLEEKQSSNFNHISSFQSNWASNFDSILSFSIYSKIWKNHAITLGIPLSHFIMITA